MSAVWEMTKEIKQLESKIDQAKEILVQLDFFDLYTCIDEIRDVLCDHENIKYQPNEPENNIMQGAWCEECNKEMEWEEGGSV